MSRLRVTLGLVGMTIGGYAAATPAELDLVAVTNPAVSIAKKDFAHIQYRLNNHSDKSYRFAMKPLSGIMQETQQNDYCSPDKILKPGASCLLSLLVSGENSKSLQSVAPVLCDESWVGSSSNQVCVQPKPDERITISESIKDKTPFTLSVERAVQGESGRSQAASYRRCSSTSLASCNLILFYNTGVSGDYVITNTSSQYSLSGFTISLPAGVSLAAGSNSCIQNNASITLAPGKTCYFSLVASTGTHIPTASTVTIGTSGGNATATLQVLGIGDAYTNNTQLLILPTANGGGYYSINTTDEAVPPRDVQSDAIADCASKGSGYSLATIAQLQNNVYPYSNCGTTTPIGGTLTGFKCVDAGPTSNSNYWASDTVGGFYQGVQFSSGMMVPIDAGNVRCILSWTLPTAP